MSDHSNPLTTGPSRAPARAMLKAVGFSDADLKQPLIGVANTWIEIGPCNFHLRELAVHVKEGIRAAGGTPMEFNTVSISDGITMGTEGMRASLVSREVMADSIELVARGNGFDGLVVLVGCDKTIPAGAMALARLNTPGLVLYGGSIAPGRFEGREVTIQDVFEAVGANAAGRMSDSDLCALESVACPGAGACGGQFTANTMAIACEFLGIAGLGSGSVPATNLDKAGVARTAGERVMALVRKGLRPRSIITREGPETRSWRSPPRADRPTPCFICWPLRGKRVELTLGDFDRISARTPLLADLKPSGRFVATELHAAGGSPLVARRLLDGGLLHASAPTVSGRSLGDETAALAVETPGQEVVRPFDRPIKKSGGFVVLRNLAPEGGVVKLGFGTRGHRGPARVREREVAFDAVSRRAIKPGDVVVIPHEGPSGPDARCSA
jgi:dihydroxy-acid dehydratase